MSRMPATLAVSAIAALAALPLSATANIIPGNWSLLSSTGSYGTLRPGSIWAPPPPLGLHSSVVDGVLLAEGTTWNDGTWWWDQDPAANGTYAVPMGIRIDLNAQYTIDRFVVQADDNDSYQLDYWDGAAWQSAFSVGFSANGAGMRTRDSGIQGPITTNQLRFYATGGDNYYAVSEIQAFAVRVPEPGALALVSLALGAAALAGRRGRRRHA